VNERLWDLYEQLCMVEMVPLDEFVRRLKAEEFGEFPTDEVVSFLREIEANMLQNIQVKTMEHHAYAEMADEVSEQTQKMFEELIEELRRP
jgi:Ni,Fe-hydrogenase maturation factor